MVHKNVYRKLKALKSMNLSHSTMNKVEHRYLQILKLELQIDKIILADKVRQVKYEQKQQVIPQDEMNAQIKRINTTNI